MRDLIKELPLLFDNKLFDKSNEINGLFNPSFLCITQTRWNSESKNIDSYHGQAATSVHEKIHWLQFVGTSWGMMTLLIKFVQSQVLTDIYKAEGFKKVQDNFSKMHIESNYQIDFSELPLTDFVYFKYLKGLVSKQISFNLCSHGKIKYDSIHELENNFSKCIADCHFYSNIYFPIDELEYEDLEGGYKEKFRSFKEHYSLKDSLYTLDLLEGQARASEFLHFIQRGAYDKSYFIANFDKYFIDKSYWKAFGSFMFLMGVKPNWNDVHSITINLCKFCIVVDIALNPKTFLNSSFEEFLAQDVEDFFPPRRFLNCCLAAKEFQEEFVYTNEQHHKDFENFICAFNNYSKPTDLAKNFNTRFESKNLKFKQDWEGDTFQMGQKPIINYYFYVFTKYNQIRQEFPVYIQNLGISGNFPKKQMELRYRKDYKFFNCPFYCYDTEKEIINGELHRAKFFWLLSELMKSEILKCALLKKYNLENHFPFLIPEILVDALEELCLKEFGIQIQMRKSTLHK